MKAEELTLDQIISGIDKTVEETGTFSVVENKVESVVHFGKYRICGTNCTEYAEEIAERLNATLVNIKQDLLERATLAEQNSIQTKLALFPKKNLASEAQ